MTLLAGRRVCICAGAGGVGKTTVAAALALGMVAQGLKVAVIAIDPARRLAESLGLEQLGNVPTRVALDGLQAEPASSERRSGEGELWAMMLDVRRTLDELAELLLSDEGARRELFGNRIYQELSNAVAGTHEFMAVAKLYELHRAGDYDLLVLDTPPSRNALDFLDAPDRLKSFLESRTLQALLRSAGLGARVVGGSSAAMLRLLTRVTGIELLEDAASFLSALGQLRDGFRERAVQVGQLLRDPATTFVLVTAAEMRSIEEASFLAGRLRSARMNLAGVVVNQVHHDDLAAVDVPRLARQLSIELGEPLARRVAENLGDYHAQAEQDRRAQRQLAGRVGRARMIRVPQLDRQVHDLESLAYVGRFLLASEREHRRLMAAVVS